MSNGLRVWLLGGFRAEVDGAPVAQSAWRRSKARALVKLLAIAPSHRLHREQVIEALWPDHDPANAGANLRKAVHFARQALGQPAIRFGDMVSLEGEPLWVDVEAFEAEVDPGAGAKLYAGELLPEDRFESWTEAERERLRTLHLQVLLDLAASQDRRGDIRGAAMTLEQIILADPFNEEAQARLMRAHAAAGRRSRALASYRRLEAALQKELGVEPGPDVRLLFEQIAAGELPAPVPAAAGAEAPEALDPLVEERRLVTVVSVDVTNPGEPDPERARPILDAALDAVCEALGGRGARVDRTPGDAVVAFFGVPAAHEDDPERALEAASEAIERADAQGAVARAGIETGEVLARGDAVLGEPVGAANRLREQAGPGTLRAGRRTQRAAERRRGSLERSRMVGREPEIGLLEGFFAEVVERGMPRLVLLTGPAGVGKSRLAREAVAILGRRAGARVLRGRCLAAGQGVTYWALAEVLRGVCEVALDDPPGRVAEKLRHGLGTVLSAPDGELTMQALAATAGISLDGSPFGRMEPKAVAEELARAWPQFLTSLCADGPCVLLVEDLHWAGEALLWLLEQVLTHTAGALLLIATARPEFSDLHPGFGAARDDFSLLSVRPLSEGQSAELVAGQASARNLSPIARSEVVARAEGNPYFLEELVEHLAESSPDRLPDSIHSLLTARLDSLPPLEKRLLLEMAVVGRVFWPDPVARSLGLDDISEPLAELERRGLVVGRAASSLAGQPELSFKHALLREVAYASLPRARRARAHAAVGSWLAELAAGRRAEFAELIAYHFAAAAEMLPDLRQRAFAELLAAGTAARRRYAVAKAVELHQRALDLATGDRPRAQALEELGDDHASVYHGDAALEALQEALTLSSASEDRSRLCWKCANLMAVSPGAFSVNPEARACERLIQEGLQHSRDKLSRARLLVARAAAARLWRGSEPFGQGREPDPVSLEERIDGAEGALAFARSENLSDLELAASGALGVIYGIAGRYREYLALVRSEVASLDRVESRLERADILRQGAVLEITVSADFEAGVELGQRCYAESIDSNPHQLMHATWPLLAGLYWLGRWSEMSRYLDEHLAAFRADPAIECQFVREGPVIGAVMLTQAGQAKQARELAAVVGDPLSDLASASSWQARLAVLFGDPGAARLMSESKVGESRIYSPQHSLALIDALIAQQDWEALAAFLPRARALVAGNALLAPWSDRAKGIAAAAQGRPAAARRALQRALRGFRRMAAAHEVARTRETLAALGTY